ncbi:acetyl/propionyl/methylcrotonyl-CoA carboxylase subunit alpha [Corynebacterium sp. HMSC29G08]|uniref:acetyl/propionyl/methylcrotonyl-CoA carboxylase subunit alpha n=1 Tax=Corynebacterium sp. HMSC29G08 TaxID=1581069 RepID=UPI0008A65FFD|nr:acetyl/propionyl/methylcrotonyl-CoA carboxylase subunit alpha [Corynebacterium sp. HMSC29G08]OFT82949.1 acetyl-/propionyl-CoA carboxylase subunit alpha [Corynebacterium sp. HMSC29G08]
MHEHDFPFNKVLIANRGEIAVRIIRAARDVGLSSVAIYADPDKGAPFTQMADEAVAIGGETSAQSYLDIEKVLQACRDTGADAVHPGYGFLSENAEFARRVIAEGLTWIGPPPRAIENLGDKVTARTLAEAVDAPLAPGTKDPVANADDVVAFADEHGLPVAIKAAFGGGGRGMKVARTRGEIRELYESATREAQAAFGRGECFVERYLDRARHVEAQVLADQHGNVIVGGTRDCSLQRRFQKLIEEAPAPFLTDEQRERIHSSAKAITKRAGYVGVGTVEYLVGEDGLISFLEVNTRLQVEHPVTEETTGVDMVVEQFRIAAGEPLRFEQDLEPTGHAIEFRINAEDAGTNFMPAPGTVTRYVEPSGPGVRVDSGIREGTVIGGQFDSMLAKLIVRGSTRDEAIARAKRALAEFKIEGVPTVIPFHERMLDDAAFTAPNDQFTVYTRWIEEEWDPDVAPYDTDDAGSEDGDEHRRRTVSVGVNGRSIEITLPESLLLGAVAQRRRDRKRRGRGGSGGAKGGANADTLAAPMQGTVVKVEVSEGERVEAGDVVVILEAMKMENPVKAHKDGIVKNLAVEAGSHVDKGAALLDIVADQ